MKSGRPFSWTVIFTDYRFKTKVHCVLKCLQLVCGSLAECFQIVPVLKFYIKLQGYFVNTALKPKRVICTEKKCSQNVIDICIVIIRCTADEINAAYDGSEDADKHFLTMLHVGT